MRYRRRNVINRHLPCNLTLLVRSAVAIISFSTGRLFWASGYERTLWLRLRNQNRLLILHLYHLSEACASLLFLFHFSQHRHPPSSFGKSSWLPLLGRGVVPPFIQEQIITHNHFIKNLTYWHLRHNLVEPVCKILLSNRLGSSHETPNSFFFDVKHNILSEAFDSLLLFVIILSICRMTFVQSRCVLEFSYFLPQQQDRRKHAL